MYIRRVITGLPINIGKKPDTYTNWRRESEKEIIDPKEFRLVEGKYRALNCRENPQDNSVEGSNVIFFGVFSLISWCIGFLIFIILPLIGLSIYIIVKNSLYYIESLWLKHKDKTVKFSDYADFFNTNTEINA